MASWWVVCRYRARDAEVVFDDDRGTPCAVKCFSERFSRQHVKEIDYIPTLPDKLDLALMVV